MYEKVLKLKTKVFALILVFAVFCSVINVYAAKRKTDSDRYKVLLTTKVIENVDNLESNVSRGEFAKLVVKCSPYKDNASTIVSAVANDVKTDDIYAPYIKVAIVNGYMTTYLGGNFKPDDLVTYNDLSRASLALLGYTNSDFTGNQVIGRNAKFVDLNLNENIDKKAGELLTRKDIYNGLYNTLNTKKKDGKKKLGLLTFDKMKEDGDGELLADEILPTDLVGPFLLQKKDGDLQSKLPFDVNNASVYINTLKMSLSDLYDDFDNYGYLVYSYNKDNKTLYAFTERMDTQASIAVKKGYVTKVLYNINSTVTPVGVEVEEGKYYIANDNVKYELSYAGSIKSDDKIVYLYNKLSDKTVNFEKVTEVDELGIETTYYIYDDSGSKDEEIYRGSILAIFKC